MNVQKESLIKKTSGVHATNDYINFQTCIDASLCSKIVGVSFSKLNFKV